MQKTRHFGLLLFDGFSNLCLANTVEPLRAANTLAQAPLYDWAHLGMTDAVVQSSSGLPVQPRALSGAESGAYLMVMPSYGHRDHATPKTSRALRGAARRYETLVGLDTGSWLLAAAGLLDGCRVTSHWDVLTELAETFPEIDVVEDRYVLGRSRASCGGATTTLELMLALIETHHGATLALEVAGLFMFGERAPSALPLPPDRLIRAAAALMRRHVEAPLPIPNIASQLGVSPRRLEEAFAAQNGPSPVQLYRRIRLGEARRRVQTTTQSVAEIALRSGYRDATAMTRAFRAEFGLTPRDMRKALRDG